MPKSKRSDPSPERDEQEEQNDNDGILNFNKLITYNAPQSKKKPQLNVFQEELSVFAEAKQLQSMAAQRQLIREPLTDRHRNGKKLSAGLGNGTMNASASKQFGLRLKGHQMSCDLGTPEYHAKVHKLDPEKPSFAVKQGIKDFNAGMQNLQKVSKLMKDKWSDS